MTSLTFSPDGTKVVTASRDQTARLWPLVWYPAEDSLTDQLRSDYVVSRSELRNDEEQIKQGEEFKKIGLC